jgi:hypothetical protein
MFKARKIDVSKSMPWELRGGDFVVVSLWSEYNNLFQNCVLAFGFLSPPHFF